MGIFSGARPANLGYKVGKFTPPSWKPNCVCSTIDKTDKHYIKPIACVGKAQSMWKQLRDTIAATRGVTIVEERTDYLYAEFSSGLFGFVDDVEFALDGKADAIQMRSASRLGVDDLGVNRKRIEKLREKLTAT